MSNKKQMNFKEKLKQINKEMTADFEFVLQYYLKKDYLDIKDILEIQKKIQDACINAFIIENKPEIAENLNIKIKVSIQKQTISVHPNNLFTALVFNNKYEDDLNSIEMKKIESYKTSNGLSLKFNQSDNSLFYIKTH